MDGIGDYGSSSSDEEQQAEGAQAGSAATAASGATEQRELAANEEQVIPYRSKVWTAKLPVPPKRRVEGASRKLDPFKFAGTKLSRGSENDEGFEEGSRHKKARLEAEAEKKSGLLAMLPQANGGFKPRARNRCVTPTRGCHTAVVNNNGAMHRRSAYAPRVDGLDRWSQRLSMYVCSRRVVCGGQ